MRDRRWLVERTLFSTIVAACLALSIPLSWGQTTNATLGGTVSDAAGALIPGASVKSRNTGTGIVNETITNETGTYQFASLQTGTYEITAELPGFRTQRFTNVILGGSQQVRMNFTLQVADVSTTVEVSAAADTTLATTSASIGGVLPDAQVRELPSDDRNVLRLLRGLGGVGPTENNINGYFAGNPTSAVQVTRDGFTVAAGRYDQGTFATAYTSSDLVEEIRVTTGTVDAEATRGSGQVQMVTRSGTNQFRGSVFWNNRNSALDAANWFNNVNNAPLNWINRNQFGGRLGGPIIKNKTFFFFLLDEQRFVEKENFVGTVLTPDARNGVFRYFPGVDNRNSQQINPTVDVLGNPIQNGARATPTAINLFGYDPNRSTYDPSGYIKNVLLARMPLPNDYTVGDGLNTAGIRFVRRYYGLDVNTGETYDTNNRDQINLRVDHNFNPSNKLSFVYTYEYAFNSTTTGGIENWPGGFNGAIRKRPQLYSLSFVSTFANNIVNEARWGYRGHDIAQWAPWYVGRERDKGEATTESGKEAFKLLPQYNGIPMQVVPQLFGQGFMNFSAGFGSTRGSWSPLSTYGDTISFVRGKHAFKAGVEHRRDNTDGWNDNNFTPLATIGAGSFTAPIDTNTVPTLTSTNATAARNVLYNLAGSIDNIRQGFDLRDPANPKFLGYQDGVKLKERYWHANELSAFFKDEWKVRPRLTLTAGLKWEWYGVPYEDRGLAGRVVDGYKGLCGIGCGALTTVELVGKNSQQPGKRLFENDWNNFGPSIGLSYSIPGLGKTTILRVGYGINYSGTQFEGVMQTGGLDAGGGTLPGLAGITGGNGLTYNNPAYWNLANVVLPFQPQFAPLASVPLTDTRTLTMNTYEPKRVVPYIQNFNFSIQRELTKDMLLDITYSGSKGTKLYGRIENNVVKIFNNQFLEAFNVTRAGGDHPLFDQMLMGLNIPGVGVVNGTTITGSRALRTYTNTRTLLANGSVGGVAMFLNQSTNVTNKGGGFVRNSGLFPENFLIFNPQFAEAGLNGNPNRSIYHSMEVKVTKRLAYGLTNQTSYTWSKTIGTSSSGDTVVVRDPRNRNAERSLLSFDRRHIFASSGSYTLPFGRNRSLINSAPGWLDRLVGQWQLGGIFRWQSGAPLNVTAGSLSNIWQTANNTADIVGVLPEGKITKQAGSALPNYFATLTQGNDPSRANVTATNTLNTAFSNKAMFDSNGNAVLVNPAPGAVGTLGLRSVVGPGRLELDANLVKKVRVDEKREFEFRADIVNIMNHPIFSDPNLDINSANFGRISSATDGRRFTLGARLNF